MRRATSEAGAGLNGAYITSPVSNAATREAPSGTMRATMPSR